MYFMEILFKSLRSEIGNLKFNCRWFFHSCSPFCTEIKHDLTFETKIFGDKISGKSFYGIIVFGSSTVKESS